MADQATQEPGTQESSETQARPSGGSGEATTAEPDETSSALSRIAGGDEEATAEAGETPSALSQVTGEDTEAIPATDASFTSVSAGLRHTCGLKVSGSVACWGYDDDGEATPPGGILVCQRRVRAHLRSEDRWFRCLLGG